MWSLPTLIRKIKFIKLIWHIIEKAWIVREQLKTTGFEIEWEEYADIGAKSVDQEASKSNAE